MVRSTHCIATKTVHEIKKIHHVSIGVIINLKPFYVQSLTADFARHVSI